MSNNLLIYEINCLNCFLSTDIQLLRKIKQINIPQYCYYNFRKKLQQEKLEYFDLLINEKIIKRVDFEVDSPEYTTFIKLINGENCICKSKSESLAISLAKHSNYTIITKTSTDFELKIKHMPLIDLINEYLKKDLISKEESEEILKNM